MMIPSRKNVKSIRTKPYDASSVVKEKTFWLYKNLNNSSPTAAYLPKITVTQLIMKPACSIIMGNIFTVVKTFNQKYNSIRLSLGISHFTPKYDKKLKPKTITIASYYKAIQNNYVIMNVSSYISPKNESDNVELNFD